ncbi:hypothetical protein [Nonomuraea longicatena]
MERGRGRFLDKNLAGYVVPVNADIGDIDPDPRSAVREIMAPTVRIHAA